MDQAAAKTPVRDAGHRNQSEKYIKVPLRDFLNRSGKHAPAPRYPNGEGPFCTHQHDFDGT